MTHLFVALPVLNENELLPALFRCISRQSFHDFTVIVCVNQPDEWWEDPVRISICRENQKTLEDLAALTSFTIKVIDRSGNGMGWKGNKHGVGWARKVLMDEINLIADPGDIILSLDADTTFSDNYFRSVIENFQNNPEAVGLAVPYFHLPSEDPEAYRMILHYEIYMRYYSLNLWRIGSPYTFSALGSALAVPVWAYRAVGGMTPKMSGEDFYFLQKLRKFGRLLFWNEEKVFPTARFSDRVYFGTGPAMIKGRSGDWSSYPIYHWKYFNEIEETYRLFPAFFNSTFDSPVVAFIKDVNKEEDPFNKIRLNSKNELQFIRSCHEKFDGLRILQYLKFRQNDERLKDESNLFEFVNRFYPSEMDELFKDHQMINFENSALQDLEKIRMFLFRKEELYQISSLQS